MKNRGNSHVENTGGRPHLFLVGPKAKQTRRVEGLLPFFEVAP